MFHKNSKIKAFTLSEMIVAMVITMIVVGIAYTVLNLVQRQMEGISININKTGELELLEQSLWIDINRFHKIEHDSVHSLIRLKNEQDSIFYYYTQNYIINERDTFFFEEIKVNSYFSGVNRNQGIIDAIELEINQGSLTKLIFVYKQNDALQYMN